jgi:flagellar motor switch protein FliG
MRPEEITPRYKAAVIVAQLGLEAARPVFAEMNSEEIQSLAGEVARLKEVDPSLALEIIREFSKYAATTRMAGSGGLDVARSLLDQVFDPIEAEAMFEQLVSSIAEPPSASSALAAKIKVTTSSHEASRNNASTTSLAIFV